ncbi:hypothetical protein AAG570_011407 [Ranatra chinensis]|uniref:Adenylate kinase 8 n=1 Tax=Ranatra chinensis TaxID=642074 RepID=A0ABD0YKJ2_9HEMI
MAVPASKRKLKMSPTLAPYLERHRIYELFFEIGSLLAVEKPKDHILFLRNFFYNMRLKRDRPRVVLIAPPHVDTQKLAYFMCKTLGAEPISLDDITLNIPTEVTLTFKELEPESARLAETARYLTAKEHVLRKGWVFYGYPRTRLEGRVMLRLGVIPTHTIHIVPSHDMYSPNDAWRESLQSWSAERLKEAVDKYKLNIIDLKEIFKSTFQDVAVRARSLEELAKICNGYVKRCPFKRPPMLYRIALVGTRGSCRRSLASMLAVKFNLVHVDVIRLVDQGRVMENELGEQIRRCDKYNCKIFGNIILELLNRRLLKQDCLDQGWILTNFPRDRADMEALDRFPQPPNRVIVLAADTGKCLARLRRRRINDRTGRMEYPKPPAGESAVGDVLKYRAHPDDRPQLVRQEQEYFSQHVQDLLEYCGDTCSVVSVSRGDLHAVVERLCGVIVAPSPSAEPRWPPPGRPSVSAPSSGIRLAPIPPQLHDHLPSTMDTLYFPYRGFQGVTFDQPRPKPSDST